MNNQRYYLLLVNISARFVLNTTCLRSASKHYSQGLGWLYQEGTIVSDKTMYFLFLNNYSKML